MHDTQEMEPLPWGAAVIWEARPASRGAPIREHGRLPVGACVGRWGASQSQGSGKGPVGPHRYDKQGQTGRSGAAPLFLLLRE